MYADLSLRLPSTSDWWSTARFRAELTEWVTGAVGEPLSMEPVRKRPWSTVWQVEVSAGRYFAKQNAPLQAFEARLLTALGELAPDYVVPVTAADPDRDLMLTPDQGPVLGDTLAEADQDVLLSVIGRVLAEAAELQRHVAPHADRLTSAGLVRLAPGDALPYIEQRLDDFGSLPPGDPRALGEGEAGRLAAAMPAVAAAVDQVAALGLPLTLHHNDLHTFNVFEVDGRMRFFDFGDALLSEPLGALMVPLGGIAQHLELRADDERLQRLAEPALEVWSDLAPLVQLRAALPSALRLARLARCESWIRCGASMTDPELAEYGEAAAYWLAAAAD